MKKFIAGLVIGVLLTSTGIGLASQDVIRIFIDGQEVVPDVPPQISTAGLWSARFCRTWATVDGTAKTERL